VQDFVGQTIRLTGTVSADATQIAVGSGMIPITCERPATLRGGAEVEVSMRPEDLLLQNAARPGEIGLAGDVMEVTYFGDRRECVIRVAGAADQTIVVNAAKSQNVAAGDRIFLAVDGARMKLWPR